MFYYQFNTHLLIGYASNYKIYVVADMVGGQKTRKKKTQTVQKLFKKQQEEDHQ